MNDFVFDKIQKKIIKYLGNDLEVKIPQYIDGIKVTIIGDFSFDQKNLKK